MRRAALRAAVLLSACAAARLSAQPLGPELRVNTYTTGNQLASGVASTPDGAFVVVWSGPGATDNDGVFARRFASDGSPVGSDFRVNAYTTTPQDQPRVALAVGGSFTIVWSSLAQDGKGKITARRFTSSGAPLGTEFRVSTCLNDDEGAAQIASDSTGNFVVVWEAVQSCTLDSAGAVNARRFSSGGAPLGPTFLVNAYTVGVQGRPAVAVDAVGSTYVVVWEGAGGASGTTDLSGVFGRRFDRNGSLDSDFRVSIVLLGRQAYPSVASDAAGNFVVVWSSDGTSGGPLGIFGRRFLRAGAPLGPDFQINTFTTIVPRETSVASDLAGNFVVTWTSNGQDGGGYGVFARRYDASGAPLGSEFRVNTTVADTQEVPSAAHASNGSFVVVWRSRPQDGDQRGVFAQRFKEPGNFANADGNGVVDVLDVFYLINFLFAGGPPPV